MLGKLIEHIGLEDAAELVALASTEQLCAIFDQDLWSAEHAGEDERFDSGRFLIWLEIMLEAGESFVAERLAELPRELVTLAVSRHVLVLTLDDLRSELEAGTDDAEMAEKAYESSLCEELDDFELIWRGGEGWDSLLAALLALDRDHHAVLVEILERCAAIGRGRLDDHGGLYQLLSLEESLEDDLAGEREERRAAEGYVAPTSAAAFLKMALAGTSAELASGERDALTRAYFRRLESEPRTPARALGRPKRGRHGDLRQLLEAAGISERQLAPLALPAAGAEAPLLIRGLRLLAERDQRAFFARSEELAYLVNVLLAGATFRGRRLRPAEAVEHTITSVDLGLALACEGAAVDSETAAARQLQSLECDVLLRRAWALARNPSDRVRGRLSAELELVQRLLAELVL